MTDWIQTGECQEQGAEGRYTVPPATCEMYDYREYGERCENPAVNGSVFCEEHVDTKLCKTSGIQYLFEGNSWGWFTHLNTIAQHPVDDFGPKAPTKRKQFCSDRCRNLWRDTANRREREGEVEKIKSGERSDRYAVIENYCNSGEAVVLDKKTSRIV